MGAAVVTLLKAKDLAASLVGSHLLPLVKPVAFQLQESMPSKPSPRGGGGAF
jgi:hypothetical protein